MASMLSLPEELFSCTLCLDIFTDPVVLSCSHSFCEGCLQTWWSENKTMECPVCKELSSMDRPVCKKFASSCIFDRPRRNLALKKLCDAFVQDRRQRAMEDSRTLTSSISEEDFSCTVCLEVFRDPVVLLCSHSFCEGCLQSWWSQKKTKECPVCKEISSMDRPPRNLALRRSCEAYVAALVHDEKKDLRRSQKTLKRKVKMFKVVRQACVQTAERIKVQARSTRREIQEQFEKLHERRRAGGGRGTQDSADEGENGGAEQRHVLHDGHEQSLASRALDVDNLVYRAWDKMEDVVVIPEHHHHHHAGPEQRLIWSDEMISVNRHPLMVSVPEVPQRTPEGSYLKAPVPDIPERTITFSGCPKRSYLSTCV